VEQAFPSTEIVRAGSAAEMQAAFRPNGAKIKSTYAVGIILPENIDKSLRSGELLGNGLVLKIARILPTYYLADGIVNASQNLGSPGSKLLVIDIILGSTVIFLEFSAWALRRQSAVLATI
jgi:hypothetical protein